LSSTPAHLWRGVHDTTLCDEICQGLRAGRWFFAGTPVSSTNKTYHHDVTEILLKVTLKTKTLTRNESMFIFSPNENGIPRLTPFSCRCLTRKFNCTLFNFFFFFRCFTTTYICFMFHRYVIHLNKIKRISYI
jgi:hypothetical protein